MVSVKVRKLSPQAILPKYMTEGSAGCDVTALVDGPWVIQPMQRVAIPTGLAFEIPVGHEIQVRPRSGLSLKQGLTVVNAPGTIDSDYRGEVKILVVNLSNDPVTVKSGDRVAQLVVQKVEQISFVEVAALEKSTRAEGGFGSTGLSGATGDGLSHKENITNA